MPFPRRPYLPLVLTLVVAGLGHLYLRYWWRGVSWLGLYLFTLVFLSAYTPVLLGGETIPPFIVSVLEGQLSPTGAVFPLSILILCLVDIYILLQIEDFQNGHAELD